MDLVNLGELKSSVVTKAAKKIKTNKNSKGNVKRSVVTTTTTTAATGTNQSATLNASSGVKMETTIDESGSHSSSVVVKNTNGITENQQTRETDSTKSEKLIESRKKSVASIVAETATKTTSTTETSTTSATNNQQLTKKKSKKNKRSDAEKENISVRSSFSKFDALQKKNLIHVRSGETGKSQEKFFNGDFEQLTKCAVCSKPVYKMEEIKAERNIYHRNCFRCRECDKQLSVDTYESHESVLYCKSHFKILFAPKVVEESKQEKPRKPELIIRENQPDELPPDVVRASDKPSLGLEELQELNVRSKFQVFENVIDRQQQQPQSQTQTSVGVKRSTSILSKLAKLQSMGFITGITADDMNAINLEKNNQNSSNDQSTDDADEDDDDDDDDHDEHGDDDDVDGGEAKPELVRSKRRAQRERPVGLGRAMSDIKTKFENGHMMSKEERREERKQEIQNIRSRLFSGKQARIKEMYQQAVADSEQLITSSGKKSEIDIGDKARLLKEKFEKGELFRYQDSDGEENNNSGNNTSSNTNNNNNNNNNRIDDAEVFESAISKKSRSLFMELDASAAAEKIQQQQQQQKHQKIQARRLSSSGELNDANCEENETTTSTQPNAFHHQNKPNENVIKHDEKTDDVKIETSEISSKFQFFETYRPIENQKKQFRITPPREGVVKLPTSDVSENGNDDDGDGGDGEGGGEQMKKTEPIMHTTTIMLNKFRELEQSKNHRQNEDFVPKPLKCFTPPPNDGRRLVERDNSSDEYEDEDDDDDDDDDDNDDDSEYGEGGKNRMGLRQFDDALREAQLAARAKKLREKFEKWEASEIQREMNDGTKLISNDQCADGSTIESTKVIREKFENLNNSQTNLAPSARPRYKVNRFV